MIYLIKNTDIVKMTEEEFSTYCEEIKKFHFHVEPDKDKEALGFEKNEKVYALYYWDQSRKGSNFFLKNFQKVLDKPDFILYNKVRKQRGEKNENRIRYGRNARKLLRSRRMA